VSVQGHKLANGLAPEVAQRPPNQQGCQLLGCINNLIRLDAVHPSRFCQTLISCPFQATEAHDQLSFEVHILTSRQLSFSFLPSLIQSYQINHAQPRSMVSLQQVRDSSLIRPIPTTREPAQLSAPILSLPLPLSLVPCQRYVSRTRENSDTP
jgi:hypothetical protein